MDAARSIARAGEWSGTPTDSVTLDYDARHRRRLVLVTDSGRELLLDLGSAVRLRDGDALCMPDGHVVVRAATEPLLELCAPDPNVRVRLAWHLGNRHVPAQLGPDGIRIRPDHVLADLAQRLGADVRTIEAAFEPEAGAYDATGHAHVPADASSRAPWR